MANPRVAWASLGCVKNLVESEVLLGRLARSGFDLCADPLRADVLVVNTCGFLRAAEQESLRTIEAAVALKGHGRLKAVVAAGCLPQRRGPALAERLRGVDAILGVRLRDRIVRVCRDLLRRPGSAPRCRIGPPVPHCTADRDRVRLTPRHTAYVRISEGCSHGCTFCAIPRIRGKYRSKPMEVILGEVRELAADGAREINLVGQDTTSYGTDRFGRPRLDELLRRLEDVDGLDWIRILYGFPATVTDGLIREMARNSKVVKYLDLPIQHTREPVLRAMRRGVTERFQKDLIRRLREGVPGIVLRTTILVGFPGETERDFEGLLEDLREIRFDRLGAFSYSREPGTVSDTLPGHLPSSVLRDRRRRVLQLQQGITFARNRRLVGLEADVLIDRPLGRGRWEGRTAGEAPEMDPVVRLRGGPACPGDLVRARVTGWKGYDLVGEIL